jgi:hypothetical protein
LIQTVIRPRLARRAAPAWRLALRDGDLLEGRLSRQALAEVRVELLAHQEARGKTFEVIERGDAPALDWAEVLSGFEPDQNWKQPLTD